MYTKTTKTLSPIWLAVGLDPINQDVVLLGLADTEAESKQQHQRAEESVTFRQTFLMTADTFPRDFHGWLLHCKVPRPEASNILKRFSDLLAGMFDPNARSEVRPS